MFWYFGRTTHQNIQKVPTNLKYIAYNDHVTFIHDSSGYE